MSNQLEEQLELIKEHCILTDSKNGEMLIYKNDNTISYSIFLYGEYCDAEVEIMCKYLNEDSLYLDIGTNIGYHARAVAQRTNSAVLAFEPHIKHFAVAAYNCQGVPVKLYNAAVSDQPGTLKISDFDFTNQSNFGTVAIDDNGSIEVQVMTVDQLELNVCTLMKIDTEGQELKVLQGAENTINKHRPIIFYEAIGETDWLTAYDHLEAKGYKQYWVGVRTYPMKENHKKNTENPFGQSGVTNIMAFPAEKEQPDYLVPVNGHESYNQMVARLQKMQILF
jgi:FkbM family methyltransferase